MGLRAERAPAWVTALALAASCGEERAPVDSARAESSPDASAVWHLARPGAKVARLGGRVQEVWIERRVAHTYFGANLDAPRQAGALAVHGLPDPGFVQLDSLAVRDHGGRDLERRATVGEVLERGGWALLPRRSRLPAQRLHGANGEAGAPRRERPGPPFDPAHLHVTGATLEHRLTAYPGRGRLRLLVRTAPSLAAPPSLRVDGQPVGRVEVLRTGDGWRLLEASFDVEPGPHRFTWVFPRANDAQTGDPWLDVRWVEHELEEAPWIVTEATTEAPLRASFLPRRQPPLPDWVLDPATSLAREGVLAGRPEPSNEHLADPLPGEPGGLWLALARIDVAGDRRVGWWLPAPSWIELRRTLRAGDRLRFAVGVGTPPPPTQGERFDARFDRARDVAAIEDEVGWRLSWEVAGVRRAILAEGTLSGRGAGSAGWREQEVMLDDGLAGRGTLRFESLGGTPVPLAIGEPRVVRAEPPARVRPNLLLYLVDTLRADHLSCYGARNPTSPRIDALAADGYRFEGLYAVAPWTRPTTATVLTGYAPDWHGVGRELPLPAALETLAETLGEVGASTWAFVANDQVGARGLGFDQGFARFVGPDGLAGDAAQASSTRLNATLFPWLERCADEPFFLYVHSMDPHTPYAPPADAARPFGRDYTGELLGEDLVTPRLQALGAEVSEADRRYVEDQYDNEIEHQDRELGRLLDHLDALGVLEDTVVVVLSDHGEELFEHGDWNHGYRMWEELLRVPFVLWVPARWRARLGLEPDPEARVVDGLLAQTDLVPGLLDLLGVEDRFPRQGRSWLPLLRGEVASLGPIHGVDYQVRDGDELGALRSGPWKLIWSADGERRRESLYDLDTDPGEGRDLGAMRPERLAELRALREARGARVEALRARLEAQGLGHVRPATEEGTERVTLDADALQRLEALGYAAGVPDRE